MEHALVRSVPFVPPLSLPLLFQSLTLAPTVRDGIIIYEDSPLVRAVRAGHVLVVDEADKAPTQVRKLTSQSYLNKCESKLSTLQMAILLFR